MKELDISHKDLEEYWGVLWKTYNWTKEDENKRNSKPENSPIEKSVVATDSTTNSKLLHKIVGQLAQDFYIVEIDKKNPDKIVVIGEPLEEDYNESGSFNISWSAVFPNLDKGNFDFNIYIDAKNAIKVKGMEEIARNHVNNAIKYLQDENDIPKPSKAKPVVTSDLTTMKKHTPAPEPKQETKSSNDDKQGDEVLKNIQEMLKKIADAAAARANGDEKKKMNP